MSDIGDFCSHLAEEIHLGNMTVEEANALLRGEKKLQNPVESTGYNPDKTKKTVDLDIPF